MIDVREFADWCKSKPRDETYNYIDNYCCPVAQFLQETGKMRHPCVTPGRAQGSNGELLTWDETELDELIHNDREEVGVLSRKTWNFGALSDRLEAYLATA